jgi:hypothetical protein
VYRPSTREFLLKNTNTGGEADIEIVYGAPGDQPLVGDWNGDGIQTIGVYRPSTREFLLKNTNTGGETDIEIVYGAPGDQSLVGDWNG